MKVRYVDETSRVRRAANVYAIKNLGHLGALTRKVASRSIRRRRGPSKPGTPPNTHRGLLRKSIVYAVDPAKGEVLIGPSAAVIDQIGAVHEHGETTPDGRYPRREFMGPAFDVVRPRIAEIWRDSIKG